MILNILVLLVAGLTGSFILLRSVNWKQNDFKFGLIFAGGYLFAITILHILPALFTSGNSTFAIGFFILAGFFLQQVLEYMTSGVEHGHFHVHHEGHKHSINFGLTILLGLSIHSFLEGTMLSMNTANEIAFSNRALLMGVVLHKIPASIALASVLICCFTNRVNAFLLVVVFAIASPLGLVLSTITSGMPAFSSYFIILYAIVTGNFLHISTTIVFESSSEHKFNLQRLMWSLLGAGLAIGVEFMS